MTIASEKKWDSTSKNIIREELMKFSKKTKVAKTALMMPAGSCLCVKEALRQGVIDKKTYIVCVERDKKVIKHIVRNLNNLGIENYDIFSGDLFKLKLNDYFHGAIDFVYLDTCCHLSLGIAVWIEDQLRKHINAWSVACFTFMNTDRAQLYSDVTFETEYVFSNIPKTDYISTQLVEMVNSLIYDNKIPYVRYGRAYKNGKDAAPMLTFSLSRFLPHFRTKSRTGKLKTFDLGYV